MSPQSKIENPKSKIRCASHKSDGTPCHARPRPGSDYCAFHDPACAAAFTAGRRKGGSRPYRRARRPRPSEAADLLFRLFAAAVDAPDTLDAARLRALANLAPTLLAAVQRLPDAGPPSPPQRGSQ